MKVMLALTPKAILNEITSYDIFKYYIANFSQVGKFFCSELRADNNPTCVIAAIGNDLKYKDFKYIGFMNCFDYVKAKYNVNFNEALQIINIDFNLNLISTYKTYKHESLKQAIKYNIDLDTITQKSTTIISVCIRDWNLLDKQYWNVNYNVTIKDLQKFKVYPISGFYLNDTYYTTDYVAYGYYFGKDLETGLDLWKIYQPYSKFKWVTNTSSKVFQGYNILPDKGNQLIITKSYKDVIVLSKLNINAIAPQSEVCNLDSSTIEELKNRFSKIYILYDNDNTGKRNAYELSELLKVPYFFMPEEFKVKDASDYVKKYSLEKLYLYLLEHDISCNYS